jgi:hypothetical protein
MPSELNVNKISPASGTSVTLGDSGDTFTVPSGATIVNSGTATGFGSTSASDLSSGTLPDARFPATLPAISGASLTGIDTGSDTSLSNLSATGKNKVCLLWINFNGTGTIAIRDSHNVSSISDNGVGVYQVNFNTQPSNDNYAISASANIGSSDRIFVSGSGTATSVRFNLRCIFYSGNNQDCPFVHAQVFGDY